MNILCEDITETCLLYTDKYTKALDITQTTHETSANNKDIFILPGIVDTLVQNHKIACT